MHSSKRFFGSKPSKIWMHGTEARLPCAAMEWLNYHHLRYFFVVAREGSIAKAGALLHTSQPAISTQLRQLERSLGEKLFQKQGRGLVLTDTPAHPASGRDPRHLAMALMSFDMTDLERAGPP